MLTIEQYLNLQRIHRISISAIGKSRWSAGVIVATDEPNVFNYEQAEGSDPVEVMEKLAKRMGWVAEQQGSLFGEADVKQEV